MPGYRIGKECPGHYGVKHTTLEPTRLDPSWPYPLWPVYREDGFMVAMFHDRQDALDWVAARAGDAVAAATPPPGKLL